MRNIVVRADGKRMHATRIRGQLFVCADGCCCGRTEQGLPAVPRDRYHREWLWRRLRNRVHLTIGGCLGPCALANVVMLLWGGRTLWFHSVNDEATVVQLYDYIDTLLDADAFVPPPAALDRLRFTAATWEERPDGQPVADRRPRRPLAASDGGPPCIVPPEELLRRRIVPDRLVAGMDDRAAGPPRSNGELVFHAAWEGRAFGMALTLHEQQAFAWDEFRDRLIAQIAAAGARGEPEIYYEHWLAALETVLLEKGLLTREELEERTEEYEFGERDEVF
jgi:cobaltochelatase CobN